MKTFEIVIYDWDKEIEYERRIIKCDTYAEMMTLVEQRCQEIMKEYNLDEVCWNHREVV